MITSTIKNITSVLCTWLLYLIGMLPIINCIVAVYWLFNQREREISFEKHHKLTYVIYISAFITLMGILHIGIEQWLFIIPHSWGSYDDGEWVATRSTMAGMLAFAGSFLVAYIFGKYVELNDKIERFEEERYRKEKECRELKETLEVVLEEDEEDDEEDEYGLDNE